MNAYEYRKTLTPRQADAFHKLLEGKFRDSGFYKRNWEANTKVEELQRQARLEIKDEFDALELTHRANKAEIRAKIAELHEQERTLDKAYQEAEVELFHKAHSTVQQEVKSILSARGNAEVERELITQMAIAEYDKRLAKKNKAVA